MYDVDALRGGSKKQQEVFEILRKSRIMVLLRNYTPALAGTAPLDMWISGSDLDIICQSPDLNEFDRRVKEFFHEENQFESYRCEIRGVTSSITKFEKFGFPFELFCQNQPVQTQFAVIHLMVEMKLLKIGGEEAKAEIVKLKQQGLKTEPAFAHYFGIEGDPYLELAKLANLSFDSLQKHVAKLLNRLAK